MPQNTEIGRAAHLSAALHGEGITLVLLAGVCALDDRRAEFLGALPAPACRLRHAGLALLGRNPPDEIGAFRPSLEGEAIVDDDLALADDQRQSVHELQRFAGRVVEAVQIDDAAAAFLVSPAHLQLPVAADDAGLHGREGEGIVVLAGIISDHLNDRRRSPGTGDGRRPVRALRFPHSLPGRRFLDRIFEVGDDAALQVDLQADPTLRAGFLTGQHHLVGCIPAAGLDDRGIGLVGVEIDGVFQSGEGIGALVNGHGNRAAFPDRDDEPPRSHLIVGRLVSLGGNLMIERQLVDDQRVFARLGATGRGGRHHILVGGIDNFGFPDCGALQAVGRLVEVLETVIDEVERFKFLQRGRPLVLDRLQPAALHLDDGFDGRLCIEPGSQAGQAVGRGDRRLRPAASGGLLPWLLTGLWGGVDFRHGTSSVACGVRCRSVRAIFARRAST